MFPQSEPRPLKFRENLSSFLIFCDDYKPEPHENGYLPHFLMLNLSMASKISKFERNFRVFKREESSFYLGQIHDLPGKSLATWT